MWQLKKLHKCLSKRWFRNRTRLHLSKASGCLSADIISGMLLTHIATLQVMHSY